MYTRFVGVASRTAETGERFKDPVVEAYKPGVDLTLLDRNLRLTPAERLEQLQSFVAFLADVRRAGRGRTASS